MIRDGGTNQAGLAVAIIGLPDRGRDVLVARCLDGHDDNDREGDGDHNGEPLLR
jgi:hypothetical protein